MLRNVFPPPDILKRARVSMRRDKWQTQPSARKSFHHDPQKPQKGTFLDDDKCKKKCCAGYTDVAVRGPKGGNESTTLKKNLKIRGSNNIYYFLQYLR